MNLRNSFVFFLCVAINEYTACRMIYDCHHSDFQISRVIAECYPYIIYVSAVNYQNFKADKCVRVYWFRDCRFAIRMPKLKMRLISITVSNYRYDFSIMFHASGAQSILWMVLFWWEKFIGLGDDKPAIAIPINAWKEFFNWLNKMDQKNYDFIIVVSCGCRKIGVMTDNSTGFQINFPISIFHHKFHKSQKSCIFTQSMPFCGKKKTINLWLTGATLRNTFHFKSKCSIMRCVVCVWNACIFWWTDMHFVFISVYLLCFAFLPSSNEA